MKFMYQSFTISSYSPLALDLRPDVGSLLWRVSIVSDTFAINLDQITQVNMKHSDMVDE